MNYLLLKFLAVNGVNVFAIYLNTAEALLCRDLKYYET